MIPFFVRNSKKDFASILTAIDFIQIPKEDIINEIPVLKKKFKEINKSRNKDAGIHWIMGELRQSALGNISLAELKKIVENTYKT